MKALIVLALVFVAAVVAHEQHSSRPHNSKLNSTCQYRSTKGVRYDLRLLDHNIVTDLQYFDVASSSTFYFRPCGYVTSYQQHGNKCPAGSSVCMVSSSGKAVNFGSSDNIQWADGVEDHASVEAAYGKGELCNNGAPRKTFVEYVCNLKKTYPVIVNVTMIDDCTAKFIIETGYGCPVANFCSSITTDTICKNQLNICQWSSGKCAAAGCSAWGHFSETSPLVLIIMIACACVLLACTCGLCVCACKKRRNNRRARARACGKKGSAQPARKLVKRGGSAKKQPVKKNENVEYAPFQMPFQLVPGGFAPINPYSNIQGYPMVTLAAPVDENEQV